MTGGVPSLTCGLTQHVALPVVVLTACFACVILTWPWDQWTFPKFEVAWLVVDLLCLPRVFCRVLALAACQPLAVMLDSIVQQFHGSPSLFILGLPFWHLVPPLTGKGRWCCDFARAGFRQNICCFPQKRAAQQSIDGGLYTHCRDCHYYGMDDHKPCTKFLTMAHKYFRLRTHTRIYIYIYIYIYVLWSNETKTCSLLYFLCAQWHRMKLYPEVHWADRRRSTLHSSYHACPAGDSVSAWGSCANDCRAIRGLHWLPSANVQQTCWIRLKSQTSDDWFAFPDMQHRGRFRIGHPFQVFLSGPKIRSERLAFWRELKLELKRCGAVWSCARSGFASCWIAVVA